MSGPQDILRMDGQEVEKKMEAYLKRKRSKELADMKQFLSTPEGKRVAHRILAKCQAFVDAEGPDVNQTFINIGKQKIGHWLLAEMDEARPTAYQEMVREHRSGLVEQEKIINNIKKNKEEGDV